MIVRLYHFSKRNRSTKQPDQADTYQEINVALKEGTSVTNPVLLCQTVNAAAFNYFYIPGWNRYYFVSNGVSIENMWQISGIEDYLASYKASILLTSANVLYATASTKSIVDTRIPVLSTLLLGHEQAAIPDITITDSGSYAPVLGITGKGSNGIFILQNSLDVNDLLDGVDDWWATDVQSQLDAAKQLFFGGSAANCIKAAIGIPIVYDWSSMGVLEDLYLGSYPCKRGDGSNIRAYRITNPILKKDGSIIIPWQSSDWKRTDNYSSIILYFPFIGIISVNASEIQNESTLNYTYSINVTSGDISLEVRTASTNKKLSVASSNCAINLHYGSTGVNTNRVAAAVGSVGAIAGGIIAAASAGTLTLPAMAAIGGGLAGAAGNTLAALGGYTEGSGGLGGGSTQGLDKVVHCYVLQKQLTDTQTNFDPVMGKPYMGVATIGSFTGYVQTDGFQLADIQAYSEEKDMINQLMDSGVYIE